VLWPDLTGSARAFRTGFAWKAGRARLLCRPFHLLNRPVNKIIK